MNYETFPYDKSPIEPDLSKLLVQALATATGLLDFIVSYEWLLANKCKHVLLLASVIFQYHPILLQLPVILEIWGSKKSMEQGLLKSETHRGKPDKH